MCPGKGASADARVEKRVAAHCARDVTGRGTKLEEKRVENNSECDESTRGSHALSSKTLVPWIIVYRTLTSGPENNFHAFLFLDF